MATEIYGHGDDVAFEGDVTGEVCGLVDADVLVLCSDGTVLEVSNGKRGIWRITVLERGSLLTGVDTRTDKNVVRHSDTARFADGLKWAFAATEWDRVS